MRRAAYLLAALATAACGDSSPTCDQPTGAWRDHTGRPYHLVGSDGNYELYALHNTASTSPDGTVHAPVVFDLQLRNRTVSGRRTQRRERGPDICAVRRTVTGNCQNRELTLRYATGGQLDWHHCRIIGPTDPAELRLVPD